MPKDLKQFIEWVVSQKPELTTLDQDIRDQLVSDLTDRLEDQVNAALIAAMPPGQLAAFEQVAESSTNAEVRRFCEQHINGLDELVAGVLLRFQTNYLGQSIE